MSKRYRKHGRGLAPSTPAPPEAAPTPVPAPPTPAPAAPVLAPASTPTPGTSSEAAAAGYDIVLECRALNHWFGANRVLYDINLKIARGEVVGLVGESGCGKSTLLRAILGTHPPRAGEVLMNGEAVTNPGRDRGIVYQRYSLFPHLTALQNVAFGLMLDQTTLPFRVFQPWRWWPLRRRHLEEAAELLLRFKMGHALKKYPSELSGGMCQRVAIAQSLIMKPQILLLDEPFGALDEATREEQQQLLIDLYRENLLAVDKKEKPPHTIIIVTHELNEALYVSDRIIALSPYWDWQAEGKYQEHPGSTLVYDKVGPPMPRDPINRGEEFRRQRDELRLAAFQKEPLQPRNEYVHFWEEVAEGKGIGVLQPGRGGPVL